MNEKYIIFALAAIVVALMVAVIDIGETLSRCREELRRLQKNKDQHDV